MQNAIIAIIAGAVSCGLYDLLKKTAPCLMRYVVRLAIWKKVFPIKLQIGNLFYFEYPRPAISK